MRLNKLHFVDLLNQLTGDVFFCSDLFLLPEQAGKEKESVPGQRVQRVDVLLGRVCRGLKVGRCR